MEQNKLDVIFGNAIEANFDNTIDVLCNTLQELKGSISPESKKEFGKIVSSFVNERLGDANPLMQEAIGILDDIVSSKISREDWQKLMYVGGVFAINTIQNQDPEGVATKPSTLKPAVDWLVNRGVPKIVVLSLFTKALNIIRKHWETKRPKV